MQRELSDRSYRPGGYVNFYIREPKRRKISAAPFRDRVVHHALCNLIEQEFDRRFIQNSYANRLGKGTHRALDHLQILTQHYWYGLRVDIVKHFPSLDHRILQNEISRVVSDTGILWLVEMILESGTDILRDEYEMVYFPGDDLFAASRPRGLPIGNLTSQFWSNVYMNPLDQFVTRELGCSSFLRYVDDMAFFSNSRQQLYDWKAAIRERLARLRLTLHEREAQVTRCMDGIPWLGFVVYPTHRRLKQRNAVGFRRRLEANIDLYQAGKISFAELDASVQGWINHVRYADTWGLREHIFETHPIHTRPGLSPKETLFKRKRLYWMPSKKSKTDSADAERHAGDTPAPPAPP